MHSTAQLSFVVRPRVLLRYHPDMAPPDAEGPFEVGTFCASLARHPRLCACGGTERTAVQALADLLLTLAPTHEGADLSALRQVLNAAERYTAHEFVDYLQQRSEPPVLAA